MAALSTRRTGGWQKSKSSCCVEWWGWCWCPPCTPEGSMIDGPPIESHIAKIKLGKKKPSSEGWCGCSVGDWQEPIEGIHCGHSIIDVSPKVDMARRAPIVMLKQETEQKNHTTLTQKPRGVFGVAFSATTLVGAILDQWVVFQWEVFSVRLPAPFLPPKSS